MKVQQRKQEMERPDSKLRPAFYRLQDRHSCCPATQKRLRYSPETINDLTILGRVRSRRRGYSVSEPEIVTSIVSIRACVGISSQVAEVLHQHKRFILFRVVQDGIFRDACAPLVRALPYRLYFRRRRQIR